MRRRMWLWPTKALHKEVAAPYQVDANDLIYQVLAVADYNPVPELKDIKAAVLAIDSTDDERDPQLTGFMAAGLEQVRISDGSRPGIPI